MHAWKPDNLLDQCSRYGVHHKLRFRAKNPRLLDDIIRRERIFGPKVGINEGKRGSLALVTLSRTLIFARISLHSDDCVKLVFPIWSRIRQTVGVG